jgi:hypothetical protein
MRKKTKLDMVLKIIRDTHLWKKGQKVYAQWHTGSLAAPVKGRYKGSGRWINAWVHYPDEDGRSFSGRPDAIWLS